MSARGPEILLMYSSSSQEIFQSRKYLTISTQFQISKHSSKSGSLQSFVYKNRKEKNIKILRGITDQSSDTSKPLFKIFIDII